MVQRADEPYPGHRYESSGVQRCCVDGFNDVDVHDARADRDALRAVGVLCSNILPGLGLLCREVKLDAVGLPASVTPGPDAKSLLGREFVRHGFHRPLAAPRGYDPDGSCPGPLNIPASPKRAQSLPKCPPSCKAPKHHAKGEQPQMFSRWDP